ncbi:LIM zinc finger domain containing 2 [Phyllostomus discolor]|uniref:LIM zinc finger domain containing 2 n=1 Tax=Phyllostomus discolor TaxID=89673 RepID=A0A834AR83_9CHIR|nr:LIM zinc finger domain containing 2 [Phyllostomus discolor]
MLVFGARKSRHLCWPCHNLEKAKGLGPKYICQQCYLVIKEQPLMFRNNWYHLDHYSCTHCSTMLEFGALVPEAAESPKEIKEPFAQALCWDRAGPLRKLLPEALSGDVCYSCRHVIEGDLVSALNKAWCVNYFSCCTCNNKLTLKNKFMKFDMKPVWKRCYKNFPLELKKWLKKLAELAAPKAYPKSMGPPLPSLLLFLLVFLLMLSSSACHLHCSSYLPSWIFPSLWHKAEVGAWMC